MLGNIYMSFDDIIRTYNLRLIETKCDKETMVSNRNGELNHG